MLGSIIAKYIEKNIDTLCNALLGDIYDEYDEKYSDVYKYEIQGFLGVIESSVDSIFNIHKDITKRDLKTILITENGFCGDYDEINIEELDKFIESTLTTCLSEYYLKNSIENKKAPSNNLSEAEEEFIKVSIDRTYDVVYNHLTDIMLNDGFAILKNSERECDVKKYNDIVSSLKTNFVLALNLKYKLYNDIPTKDSVFEGVCTHFDIKRNEFLF